MQTELVRILEKLMDLQKEILSLMASPKTDDIEEKDVKTGSVVPLRPKPGSRLIWRDHHDSEWGRKVRAIIGLSEYGADFHPAIGIAYLKTEFTREVAWASAQRAWRQLRAENRVPSVPYNCLRKAHTKDWYIWVYDPEMSKKKWVSERIQQRKEE